MAEIHIYVYIHYVDKSVLVENRLLLKFIRNYIRDLNGSEDIDDVISLSYTVVCAKLLLSI